MNAEGIRVKKGTNFDIYTTRNVHASYWAMRPISPSSSLGRLNAGRVLVLESMQAITEGTARRSRLPISVFPS